MPGIKEAMSGHRSEGEMHFASSGADMNKWIPIMIGLEDGVLPQLSTAPVHREDLEEYQPPPKLTAPIVKGCD